MYRRATLFPLLFLSVFGLSISLSFSQASENPYILVDARSGNILAANKPDDRWYPASLTKLMTAYVTFQAIKDGELEEGSPVVISDAARRQPPSKMGYKRGVKLRVDTALKIIIIKSANDVSHALAEAVAGSVTSFVRRMNETAKKLGMTNTQFANSNGLHSAKQYSSARDMALLSSRIFSDFPQYAYMFQAVAVRTSQKTHYSYNLLLERFKGSNGMKTGFVCASGYNMVASAARGNRTLIAVVLGRSSQKDRAVSAARLLENGFKVGSATLGNIFDASRRGSAPKNMRPILCTEAARKNRYEPGAGQAKISSPFLSARFRSDNILNIRAGGTIGGNAISTARIPIPTKRPDGLVPARLEAIGNIRTGKISSPTPRPRQN